MGEFYEVAGDLRLERLPCDAWTLIGERISEEARHFLFYFKDETFEVMPQAGVSKSLRFQKR
jgi:hypothetical protein